MEWAQGASPGSVNSACSQTLSARKPGGLGVASPRISGRQAREAKRNPRRTDSEKSDGFVVPKKPANTRVTPVELVEGRDPAKEKPIARNTRRTQRRGSVPTYLQWVGQRATKDRTTRFNNLYGHLRIPLLRDAFEALRKSAAPGVDKVSWVTYASNLSVNLANLEERLHRGTYHPPPVRRVYIPKADGKERPLGVPTIEDKLVQQAVRMILEPIYEQLFLGFSYGFRPGRSQHQALDALAVAITRRRTNWVLDADIQSFFETLHHGKLKEMLEERITDRRLVRLIMKWLHAGVWESGTVTTREQGTPQGGVISPLLSNIYLHHVLDRWVHQWRQSEAKRPVYVVRYADDVVMAFGHGSEARMCRAALRRRLAEYGLKLHDQKTRLIRFGRFAWDAAKREGRRKPDTFDFLGFTHISARARDRTFLLLRLTSKKKRQAKFAELSAELRRRRHERIPITHQWLCSVLRGHYNYYGVPGNLLAMRLFRGQLQRAWYRQLEGRSQRGQRTIAEWVRFEERYRLLTPRIVHPWPEERFALR